MSAINVSLGLSFSFGRIPLMAFGQEGVGAGLRVLFTSSSLRVVYMNVDRFYSDGLSDVLSWAGLAVPLIAIVWARSRRRQ